MALTQIRGAQIQDQSILNQHVNNAAAIAYSKLNLLGSIVATDLSGHSVSDFVLGTKLMALWDLASGVTPVSGTSNS